MTTEPVALRGGLVVDALTWRPYGRHDPTLVDLTLTLRPGERVLLVGASGSGKSTLLQAMAGLLDDSLGEVHGEVSVDGRPPGDEPGSVGLLLQDPTSAVVAEHAGRDAAFGPENRALPPRQVRDLARHALDEVGFPYGADRSSFALSGGEASRLALAGALALEPRVLLLDEPTAMLDARAAASVRAAVQTSAAARGLTVVVVEHRLEGWVEWCDRLVVLDRGRLLADGAPAEVLVDQRNALLAAGVWVPGVPAPAPAVLPPGTTARAPDPDPAAGPGRTPERVRLAGVEVAGRDGAPLLAAPVDLVLTAGGAATLTGPSGVGKSTLLAAVAGLTPVVSGQVLLGHGAAARPAMEVAASSLGLARTVGWLPQHPEAAFCRGTVRAEVLATSEALLAGDPHALERARTDAHRLLVALGLAGLAEADPHRLSGGEQRRLALAAALLHRPEVLLLDEPTVGQDRHTWSAVAGLVEAARRDGAAVLATTHDPAFAAALGPGVRLEPARTRTTLGVPDHTVRPVVEPGAPPAARSNPLALLVVAAAAAVGSFWVDSVAVGLLTLAWSVLLAPLAVRRVRPALLRLVPVGLAALSVGWSTLLFSRYGWFAPEAFPVAAREVTRILCLVVPGALVAGLLRPSSLGDALAGRLHLPARPVLAATSALLRLDQLAEHWRSLADLRRIRGLAPGRSPAARARHLLSLTVALLIGVLRSSQQMALSMDARGFAAADRRTFALPSLWGRRDWVCCAVALVLLATPVVLSRLL